MATNETITWYPAYPATTPDGARKCIVHAKNQWYVTAIFDPESGKFWDKDGQPVAAVIEWSYRPDRPE